jgi:hypothetical protein
MVGSQIALDASGRMTNGNYRIANWKPGLGLLIQGDWTVKG